MAWLDRAIVPMSWPLPAVKVDRGEVGHDDDRLAAK
jgi:hypothetical protein